MDFLRHASTGDVYPYNQYLARRGDMIPCDANGHPVSTEAPKPEVKAKPARKPHAKKEAVVEEVAEDVADVEVDLDLDLGED